MVALYAWPGKGKEERVRGGRIHGPEGSQVLKDIESTDKYERLQES